MQVRRSASQEARRRQVVEAAIGLVAEEGYDACTFKRIAQRAGLSSTRLISYHFDGKDDLVAAVLAELYARIGAAVAEGAAEHDDARDALAAYIRTAVALHRTHHAEMLALTRVFLHHRPAPDTSTQQTYSADTEERAVGRVEQILREGQSAGVLRDFDPWVMGTTVQRSVDGLAFLLDLHPDLDLDRFAEELVTTFDLATRR